MYSGNRKDLVGYYSIKRIYKMVMFKVNRFFFVGLFRRNGSGKILFMRIGIIINIYNSLIGKVEIFVRKLFNFIKICKISFL